MWWPYDPAVNFVLHYGYGAWGGAWELCFSKRSHPASHILRDWGLVLRVGVVLVWYLIVLGDGPSFAWGIMGLLRRSTRWNDPWRWLLRVQPRCDDEFLGVLVGSWCPWNWVLFGRRARLHFTVSCMRDWLTWWLDDNLGLWRPGWNLCMYSLSWGGP